MKEIAIAREKATWMKFSSGSRAGLGPATMAWLHSLKAT